MELEKNVTEYNLEIPIGNGRILEIITAIIKDDKPTNLELEFSLKTGLKELLGNPIPSASMAFTGGQPILAIDCITINPTITNNKINGKVNF